MFMQRLITSLILAPLVLITLFYANPWILGAVLLCVTVLAGVEYWGLIPITSVLGRLGYQAALIAAAWCCGYVFAYWLILGLLTWVLVCIAIITYPQSQRIWGFPFTVAILSLILFPLFIQSIIHVYFLPQGKTLILYLLFLIWAADIGAYLTGKCWGKTKLIPQVSPGKSWEGVSGGFVLAMLVACAGYYYFTPHMALLWFGLAVINVIISIFGDLFISILKRRCQLKDTGALIPGHGGILDRLDSLIAALPVFYFGLTYIPLGASPL